MKKQLILIGMCVVFHTVIAFSQSSNKVVKDVDGNRYKTVTIGTQTWFAENLKTTHYSDGTEVPNVTNNKAWKGLTTGAQCTYNNTTNADTINSYGRLYNWYAVSTGKLCPTGWHVPSDAEWTVLSDYLGGDSVAGGKMKESGIAYWSGPKEGAINSSGFTALPGGYRGYYGGFGSSGDYGYWWSSTEGGSTSAYFRNLYYNISCLGRYGSGKQVGFSVRCVKD